MRHGPFWFGVFAWGCTVAGGVLLIEDSRPCAVVVTPSEPSSVVSYAAAELIDHVSRATGVRLPLAREDDLPASPSGRVYLGPCRAALAAGVEVSALDPEACVVRTANNDLFLVGDDGEGDALALTTRAGTLWAVYDFLESELGVRWLWPGDLGTVVPPAERLEVRDAERTFKPWLLQRNARPGLSLRGDVSRGFSPEGLRSYSRGQSVFLRRHRMGRSVVLRYGHAFNAWWDRYGEEHEDWFQKLEDGRRGPTSPRARFSMCVSNPGLHRQIVAEWKSKRDAAPAGAFVNINCCENDIRGLCTCERCLAWDGPQPETIYPRFGPRVVSDRYAKFWLAVQQLAAGHDPSAVVAAYAYVNYAPPPSPGIELNDQIYVGTVPDVFFPRTAEEQAWVLAQWDGWARTGARVFLRPNYFLGGYCLPLVFAHQFAEEFRHEAANGMVFTDFDSLTGQWAAQGPNLYLLMRLHQHPGRSTDALLAEYYAGFGGAASEVKEYFDHWEAYTTEHLGELREVNWTRYAGSAHELFPEESFAAAEAILGRAEQAADGSTSLARVGFLRLGLDHARLTARVSAAVADEHPVAARRAIRELVDFRREHERENFSNLHFCSFLEGRSWQVPDGYGGEPLASVADTVQSLEGAPYMASRGGCMFVFLLEEGEALRARIACRQVGKYDASADWSVFGPDNRAAARGSVPVGEIGELDMPAAAAGPHVLVLATGRNAAHVTLQSDHAALSGRCIRFLKQAAPLWFWVPKGTERFRLTLESPGPGETARMVVRDPQGRTVAEGETGVAKESHADITVPPDQRGAAWSVSVGPGGPGVFEDYTLRLDAGLPPFWAHSPDRLLVPTE